MFSKSFRPVAKRTVIYRRDETLIGMEPMGIGLMYGVQRLPSEALYNVNLTLQSVVSGSLCLVTTLGGTEVARATATGGNTVIAIPYYGSDQTLKVVVRKATSAPFYQSYETQVVVSSNGAALFVSQISDES